MDLYSTVIIQPSVQTCTTREDVKRNVDYLAGLLGSTEIARRGNFTNTTRPEEWEAPPWAPVKLVVFPELALNLPGAFFGRPSVDQVIEEICIRIPGPETEALGAVARKQGVYVNCGAYEHIPELGRRVFNTSFLIAPTGEVVHKSHKYNPYIPVEMLATSPHDIYDEYLEFFGDGKKKPYEVFFPVTDTEIGRVGTLVCNDGLYPENWRALGLQGAEIILQGNFPEPFSSSPHDWRLVFSRAFAVANMCYVISCAFGEKRGPGVIALATGGSNGSFIVDPEGIVVTHVPYPGEAVTSGVIRLDHLRRRRNDPGTINLLSHLRTEGYRGLYDAPIYPAGVLAAEPAQGFADRRSRDVYVTGAMANLRQRGVVTIPDGHDT